MLELESSGENIRNNMYLMFFLSGAITIFTGQVGRYAQGRRTRYQ